MSALIFYFLDTYSPYVLFLHMMSWLRTICFVLRFNIRYVPPALFKHTLVTCTYFLDITVLIFTVEILRKNPITPKVLKYFALSGIFP